MVLDSSVMNVSISQIVADLDTSIQGVQLAITAYTLVMAAFMLAGAKLGDIWGRDRAFAIGLAVYAAGSLTTALSPNLLVLLFGWSLVEGLGAVLVIPAIGALIAANYEGQRARSRLRADRRRRRRRGGRWAPHRRLGDHELHLAPGVRRRGRDRRHHRALPAPGEGRPRTGPPPQLDVLGWCSPRRAWHWSCCAILQSSSWGWIVPKDAPTIGGQPITPLGFSVVPFPDPHRPRLPGPFRDLGGAPRAPRPRHAPRPLAVAHRDRLRGGASTLGAQQLVLMGTFFVLPVYLQVVLGLDAFETGKRLFPLSVTMLLAALTGPRLARRFAPKRVAQAGLIALALRRGRGPGHDRCGARTQLGFTIGLAIFGIGAGLLASQLGNVIMSSVGSAKTSEAGGLQGTAQNLGASLGTALIGSILLMGLTNAFIERVSDNTAIPADVRAAVTDYASASGLDVVPVSQAEELLVAAGLPPDQAALIADDYGAALLDGLRLAMGAVAFLALISLWATRRLPGQPLVEAPETAETPLPTAEPAASTG